jgi:hypothetical protein
MRRATWVAIGFGLGVGVTARARRRLDDTVPGDATDRLRRAVRVALDAGRDEMRRREASLRAVLAVPGRGTDNPGR